MSGEPGTMNVLFITHSFPQAPGDPIGSFVLRLAVALESHGIHVRVIAPSGPDLPSEAVFEGVPVHRFRYAPAARETLAYTGTMAAQVRGSLPAKAAMVGLLGAGTLTARRAARRWPAHVLHAHWWFPGGLIGMAAKSPDLPLITTLHGSDLRIARDSTSTRRLFRYVMRGSSAVTTVSGWLAREVHQLVPNVDPEVVPMPIAPDLFYPSEHRERDRLLFVGKLTEQKGFPQLLDALGRMRARPTVDVVVGVGGDPAEGRALADSRGVGDLLRWHPLLQQAELADCYRRATALVMPSVDEGLGLVAVEAMACETPVVAFDSGGLTDIVLHGETGLLVPPGDAAALARALDDILSQPDQGAAMGRAGRRRALDRFAPGVVAARYAAIYRRAREPSRA
ncbi:MAG: glycosyltransferase family 4 protein [Gemmatimonadota bacterium]